MTATKELHRLLDERGVEYVTMNYDSIADITYLRTNWGDWGRFCFTEPIGAKKGALGSMNEFIAADFSPEQAVEATLGRGECSDVTGEEHVQAFTCSECGFNCDLTSWISLFDGDDGRHRHHHHGMPSYCPNCGRKVMA